MHAPIKKYIDALMVFAVIIAVAIVPFGIWKSDGDSTSWNGHLWRDLGWWVVLFTLFPIGMKFFKASHKALILIAVLIIYLGAGVGLSQFFSVAFFSLSTFALGRLFLYSFFKAERASILFIESISIGLACYLCLFGIMIHYPINYFGVYIAVLSVPLIIAGLLQFPQKYRSEFNCFWAQTLKHLERITFWKLVIATGIIGYVARYTFFPSISYDDNALHLRMWTLLTYRHYVDFDVVSQVWSVAPFIVDLLNSILSMVAHADARGAMNLGLMAFLLYSMWQLTRLINRRLEDRLLILILFVTTPLLAGLLKTLHTELLLGVLAVTGTVLALQRRPTLHTTNVPALIMIAAMCCGTKLPGAVLGGALLVLFFFQLNAQRGKQSVSVTHIPVIGLAVSILIGGFVAFHSYGYAWITTGNPLFPLYNGIFKSPFFGQYNFLDTRFVTGPTLQSYWEFFFKTSAHLEAKDFVAGFQYLLLLPLGVLMLLCLRPKQSAAKVLLPLLIYGAAMFSTVQYWRYLYPILPLASVVIGALLLRTHGWQQASIRGSVIKGVFIFIAAINLYLLPGISWYFNVPAGAVFSEEGRQKMVSELLPEQHLNEYLNHFFPSARVLYEFERPFGATLAGSPVYINWYAPASAKRKNNIHTSEDLAQFLRAEKIDYVYWDLSQPIDDKDIYRTLLRKHLTNFAQPVLQENALIMYRLQEQIIH